MKICSKCKIEKEDSEFKIRKDRKNKLTSQCKGCISKRMKIYYENLRVERPEKLEEMQKRKREYTRKNKRTRHKESYKLKDKFPEKQKARSALRKLTSVGREFARHHWSYNESHYIDITILSRKDHKKAHRFLIYDQERFMYRRIDTNELLDTKEKHLEYIMWCIENMSD